MIAASECPVSMMIATLHCGCAHCVRSRFTNSAPSMPGMSQSSRTTSGENVRIASRPPTPSPVSWILVQPITSSRARIVLRV